jgi:hypothetical protein
MIYKNITFKADPFSYDLVFEDRITLVGGDSGTGKTVLYEMLEDLRLTDEYKAIKLFNYKSDNLLEAMIAEEEKDCHLYEKMGYTRKQILQEVNEKSIIYSI